jgi:hypothetical protein
VASRVAGADFTTIRFPQARHGLTVLRFLLRKSAWGPPALLPNYFKQL